VPTYGYECTACREQFEVFQRITEEPLAIHEGCGGELRRLLYPVGIVFKGPGFHVNDYGSKNGRSERKTESPKAEPAKAESKSDSTTTPATTA